MKLSAAECEAKSQNRFLLPSAILFAAVGINA